MAGSIQDRGNGKYLLTYSMGFKGDGKRNRKTRTVEAKNMKEAKKKLAAFVTEIETGEYIDPSKMKFGEFVNTWRKVYAYRKLSPKTAEIYDYTLNAYILPEFSHMRLDKILPMNITEYLIGLENTRMDGKEGGLSPATIIKHHNILRGIFNLAVKNHLIKTNPAEIAEKPSLPRKRKTEDNVYTAAEVGSLFKLLEKQKEHHQLIVKLAIDMGMRRGEILGLQVDDIDFNTNKIRIHHSLSYTKEKGYQLKNTKTEDTRTVKASQYIMQQLKDYVHIKKKNRLQTAELWNGGKYFFVFSDTFGKPLHPGTVSTWWMRFIERTGYKRIRFHDLRHTAVTLLINEGLHAKTISERLGHSDIKITMNTYGHFLEQADQQAADTMDNIYKSFT